MKLFSVKNVCLLAVAMLCGPIMAEASILYGIDDGTRNLFSIDTNTLVQTTIGPTGVNAGDFGDLAYDDVSGTMYWAAGRGNNNLYRVNLATGAATLIGNYGVSDSFALAWTGTALYGQSTSGAVYTIDTNTAVATNIGSNGVYPGGYDWNPNTGQLVLLSAGGGAFYSINLGDGSATALNGGAGFVNDNDVAYDPVTNTYWAGDWSTVLYKYDGATYARTTVLTGIGSVAAMELVNDGHAAVPEASTFIVWSLLGASAVGLNYQRRARRAKR